jgi:hypothetical protein
MRKSNEKTNVIASRKSNGVTRWLLAFSGGLVFSILPGIGSTALASETAQTPQALPALQAPQAEVSDSTPPKLEPRFSGGVQMGYHMGMNGNGWPNPVTQPLNNATRSGFYLAMARLQADVQIDRGLTATAKFNVVYLDLQELYFEKVWRNYTFTAGKFRGAGLRSSASFDELEALTIEAPFVSRLYSADHRLFNHRDVGVQVAHNPYAGVFSHRLFVHNSSGNSGRGSEPSWYQGAPLQALGFTYAWDWRLPEGNQVGGHLGAMADREWDEFLGPRQFWEVTYWFKTNPMVDASIYHELKTGTWTWNTEMMVRSNRRVRNAADSSASQLWGAFTEVHKKHSPRFTSIYRYEYLDPSNGTNPEDNLHLLTAGLRWKPSHARQPNWAVTGQYVLVREQEFENRVGNDIWYLQNQWTF